MAKNGKEAHSADIQQAADRIVSDMPVESQLHDSTIRSRIRERIEDGRLPVMLPKLILAGYGSGALCVACDQAIAPTQIEYEFDRAAAGMPDPLRLHLRCHVIWRIECQRRISEAAATALSLRLPTYC